MPGPVLPGADGCLAASAARAYLSRDSLFIHPQSIRIWGKIGEGVFSLFVALYSSALIQLYRTFSLVASVVTLKVGLEKSFK